MGCILSRAIVERLTTGRTKLAVQRLTAEFNPPPKLHSLHIIRNSPPRQPCRYDSRKAKHFFALLPMP